MNTLDLNESLKKATDFIIGNDLALNSFGVCIMEDKNSTVVNLAHLLSTYADQFQPPPFTDDDILVIDQIEELARICWKLKSCLSNLPSGTVERITRPVKDLLIHNGVNVDESGY